MTTALGARWALFLSQLSRPALAVSPDPVGVSPDRPVGTPADSTPSPVTVPASWLDEAEAILRAEEAPVHVYPWRGRFAWECTLPECGECGAEDQAGDAGDAGRRHWREDHA